MVGINEFKEHEVHIASHGVSFRVPAILGLPWIWFLGEKKEREWNYVHLNWRQGSSDIFAFCVFTRRQRLCNVVPDLARLLVQFLLYAVIILRWTCCYLHTLFTCSLYVFTYLHMPHVCNTLATTYSSWGSTSKCLSASKSKAEWSGEEEWWSHLDPLYPNYLHTYH